MDKVRWGIIGCGDVTEVKSGPALYKIEGSEVVAVMRRDQAKAQDYARRHGVPRWYGDAAALIGDSEVDAVYVATPPDTHCQYTLMAAAAKKPVYVEKPMARTHSECRRMIEACATAGVPLFVAYYRRQLPLFLKVKALVDQGAIGQVRFASSQLYYPLEQKVEPLPWRYVPEISGGGLFFDLGSHMLDLWDCFFGPVVAVEGRAANQGGAYGAEDIVCAHFEFQSGVLGSGLWSFAVGEQQRRDQTEIVGSAGRIQYSAFDFGPVRLENASGVKEFDLPPPPHVQQPLLQTVVDQLRGRGTCPSSGESGARTSWVLDAAVAAYRQSKGG